LCELLVFGLKYYSDFFQLEDKGGILPLVGHFLPQSSLILVNGF